MIGLTAEGKLMVVVVGPWAVTVVQYGVANGKRSDPFVVAPSPETVGSQGPR